MSAPGSHSPQSFAVNFPRQIATMQTNLMESKVCSGTKAKQEKKRRFHTEEGVWGRFSFVGGQGHSGSQPFNLNLKRKW